MKRTPLQRRTGLKPSGKPLQRTTGLPRSRSALKPFSTKRLAEIPARKRCRLIVLARDPWCVRCGTSPSTEVHELKFRGRGGDPNDPKNCVGVCHDCNQWIHLHNEEATALGLAIPSWEEDP